LVCSEFVKQKKPNISVRLFVGVAGFAPAASCSQSRRDNRATLHPEGFLLAVFPPEAGRDNRATIAPVSGCKYRNKFGLEKENLKINKTYFEIVI
jgi:hypothetical protein